MSDEDNVRDAIIRTAREYIGAHYLAGTFGQCPPSASDSITLSLAPLAAQGRSYSFITVRTWPELAVRATEIYPYRGVRLRCEGRYSAYSGLGDGAKLRLSPHLAPSATTSPPARFRSLYAWYGRIAGLPPGSRTEAFNDRAFGGRDYYPRRHSLTGDNANYVYLGEDCYGKRHFDCVGFVCYILTRVLGTPRWYGLPQSGNGRWGELGTVHEDPMNCRKGDIMLSADHVAFVAGTSPNTSLIHANGDSRGVEVSAFNRKRGTWANNFHVVNLSRRTLGLSPEPPPGQR